MSEVIGLRDEVAWFANEMERTLRDNDHKGVWHGMTLKQCLRRLRQETAELERAIEKKETPARILREAADVANFAMFIADNAKDELFVLSARAKP